MHPMILITAARRRISQTAVIGWAGLLAALVAAVMSGPVGATPGSGNFETLYSFVRSNGATPVAGVVQGADGSLYGTASAGGANGYGTVFKVSSSGAISALASFDASIGQPISPLALDSGGNLYGLTCPGNIFRVTPAGVVAKVASLGSRNNFGSCSSTALPGLVLASDGNFYGTYYTGSYFGDTGGFGYVYRLSPAGVLTTLASFTGINGAFPTSTLMQGSDGNLYGTTYAGGAAYSSSFNGYGTIYKVTLGGTLTVLASFNGSNGANPFGGVTQDSGGNLYGVAGTNNSGVIFKLSGTGTLSVLANAPGSSQSRLVQGTDGNFYGASSTGNIFSVSPNGTVNVVGTIVPGSAIGSIIQASDGDYYGVTSGGLNNSGSIYKLPGGGPPVTVASLTWPDGEMPSSALVRGPDGDFYGTTCAGGDTNSGTIFRLTPAGVLNTVVSFGGGAAGSNNDNSTPCHYQQAGLVLANDGNFYGATYLGGTSNACQGGCGTLFQMTPAGALTTLASFNGSDGAYPLASLMQASDGNLYGTTAGGGLAPGYGTVFRLTLGGQLSSLAAFDGSTTDASPESSLVQASDGKLYGTTNGGAYSPGYGRGQGSVFSVTTTGVLTQVASFDPAFGTEPLAGLALGSDGSLYGTVILGPNGAQTGAAYKVTPSGDLSYLGEFNTTFGDVPLGSLTLASDGNFYGTATSGGAGPGTVFRLSQSGVLGLLADVRGTGSGVGPRGGVTQGSDGSFYGVTVAGGVDGRGTVFRIAVPPAPAGVDATPGNRQVSLSWTAVSGATGYNVYQGAAAGAEGIAPVASVTGPAAAISGLTNGTPYYFTVTTVLGSGESVYSSEVSATPGGSSSGGGSSSSSSSGGASSSGSSSSGGGSSSSGNSGGVSSGGGGAVNPLTLSVLIAFASRRRRRMRPAA